MIVLHKKEKDELSDQLEERLNKLVISFKTMNHEDEVTKLPFIEEDGEKYKEEKEIEKWLRDLESDLNWQRSLSGDGCYINPKSGKTC